MENPYRYRNKIQMPVRFEKGEIKIGFYKSRTHEVADVKNVLYKMSKPIKLYR